MVTVPLSKGLALWGVLMIHLRLIGSKQDPNPKRGELALGVSLVEHTYKGYGI